MDRPFSVVVEIIKHFPKTLTLLFPGCIIDNILGPYN